MDGQEALPPEDQKLFPDDFQEVPVDESDDRSARKKEKTAQQPASLDVLDGLVQQAKMEEIHAPQHETSDAATQVVTPQQAASAANPTSFTGESVVISQDTLVSAPTTAEEPHDADEDLDENGDPLETEGIAKTDAKPEYPEDARMEAAAQVSLEPVRILEAALFLANKPMSHKQLQDLLAVPRDRLDYLLADLARLVPKESAYELSVNEHGAALQLKPPYLHRVARLSKEVELSKKSMRILALVAKKRELLQSDLKHFFKGEIYAYVTELKMAGYLESKKHGNTRKLKPTSKFYESFQVKE